MDKSLLRILDANANRAREALRVLEDWARFSIDDAALTAQLKGIRHDLAAALGGLPMEAALAARDTAGDVGTAVKTDSEFQRAGSGDVLAANAKRLSEALRSLEESAKTMNPQSAALLEKLRYRGYAAEQALRARHAAETASARFGRVNLCVLLTESLCVHHGWEEVLRQVLQGAAEDPAALCVQLREKGLADGEWLRRARIVGDACRSAGALAVVNDRPDIAQLAGADGVHLGQTDLPCREVRGMLGPRAIVGVSTEGLEEALRADAQGATYVAVGPMFPTTTKAKPRIVGPSYAVEALAAVRLPVVAIGGIRLENVGTLLAAGVRTVAVSSAVVSVPQPRDAVRQFLTLIREART